MCLLIHHTRDNKPATQLFEKMKTIYFEQQARKKIKAGIDLAVNAVRSTIGPYGRNWVLGKLDIPPEITNDGVSIARNIESEDETENLGVWMVKEALSFTSNKAGDSTTATAIFLKAIVDEVFDKLKEDGAMAVKRPDGTLATSKKIDVMTVKRQIDKALEEVVADLEKNERRDLTPEDLYNVALTAGEFPWIAEMVVEIFQKIGKDGYVKYVEGTSKTEYEVLKGIELPVGYQSDYFINTENETCVLKKPLILVTNNAMSDNFVLPILKIIEDMIQVDNSKAELIIIAPDFSRDVYSRCNTTKLKTDGKCSILSLKLPIQDKNDLLIDIATMVNAKFLDKDAYATFDSFVADMKIENLGTVEDATIGSSKTLLVGGEGDVKERITLLRKAIKKSNSVYDKDNYEKRIGFLSGGFATVKIGAETDFEKKYFKLKTENAVNSTQNAMRHGVIKGGGVSLKNTAERLEKNVLTNALKAPYKQIQENAGFTFEVPKTVLDSFHNIVTALKVAASQASIAITMAGSVAFKKEKNDHRQD